MCFTRFSFLSYNKRSNWSDESFLWTNHVRIGINVSKGKSMIAVMRLLGEVVAMPFEVRHTDEELNELARFTLKLKGETKVVGVCRHLS